MGFIDIHSHILPGVDDGSRSMEESLEMLRIAEAEGVSCMIATPHYKQGRYRADKKELLDRLKMLREEAQQECIGIRLHLGTEIFYRAGLEEKLMRQELGTLNDTDFLLVEFSPFEEYLYIRNAMEELLGMGYCPVAAHVERYQCLVKDATRAAQLRDMGCRIQVNTGSITGENGLGARRFVWKLLKRELVDYLGTDAHNTKTRRPAMRRCAELLYKKCSREYAEKLLFENAARELFQ